MTRSLWTLLIPTLCAAFPLFLLRFAAHDPVTNDVSSTTLTLYALVPPLGVVSVLGWAVWTRAIRPLRPLYPYIAVTLCYSVTDLVIEVSYHFGVLESAKWLGAVELVALLTFPLQPLCAVVGGLIFVLRRPPGRSGG